MGFGVCWGSVCFSVINTINEKETEKNPSKS